MTGSVAVMGKDQRTRYQGVYVRHQKSCAGRDGRRCSCRPGYIARVWDRARKQQIVSPTQRTADAAKNWRNDTIAKLDRGELPDVRSGLRLGKAVERFLEAAREGRAMNKHGRRYKPRAIEDLDSALQTHVVPKLGQRRLADVRRGDVQELVDELTPRMSGSRVRTVVNATRSLYRWAQERDHVSHDPAALVRLPAMDATPRDRVAPAAELEQLLEALPAEDALAFALAAYGTARRQELRVLEWTDIALDADSPVMLLGRDPDARKSVAALRAVPLVRPLATRLRAEYLRQGRPDAGLVFKPRRVSSRGLLSIEALMIRAMKAWGHEQVKDARTGKIAWKPTSDEALTPIGLHECRHTASTWLNAAGVNPKVASILMGHSTPERAASAAAGAAGITLSRYTHALPGDLERACELLEAYIAAELGDDDESAVTGE